MDSAALRNAHKQNTRAKSERSLAHLLFFYFLNYIPVTLSPNQPECNTNHDSRCIRNVRTAFRLIRQPIPNILNMFKTLGLIRSEKKFEVDLKCIRTACEVDSGSFEAKTTSQSLDYVILFD